MVSGVFLTPELPTFPALFGTFCPGGRRVVPVLPGEVVEPVDGAAVEDDEPPAPPPLLELLLEPPEDPCAHAGPAITQLAIKAVERVR